MKMPHRATRFELCAAVLLLTAAVAACGSVTDPGPDKTGDDSPDIAPDAGADTACTAEVLDGRDNDCDGQIDEGSWTTVVVTPHAVLAAQDSACSGQAAIASNPYACQRAARRECERRGYPAGFRPVEVDGTQVAFTCVADVERVTGVTYAALGAYVADCSAVDAYRGQCFTAIKRYCQARGFSLGIGPLNDDTSSSVDLACTNHASLTTLSFDQLRQADAACDLPAQANPWDFSCFRAYHRHCWQRGQISAWGPVEYNQVDSYVQLACLPAGPPG